MAATAQKKPVVPEPMSAADLAKKCSELMARRGALEKDLNEVIERVYSIERSRFDGDKINQAEYTKARNIQGDLESQMSALDRMVSDLMEQGKVAVSSEFEQRGRDANKERMRLIAERQKEIDSHLLPAFGEFLISRLRITGVPFNVDDTNYLRGLVKMTFGQEEKMAMMAMIEETQKDESETIAMQLQKVEDDLRHVRNGKIPSFQGMVQDATK